MQILRNNIEPISQDMFQEIDYTVMRHAFDIHNEFGRFFDEKIYQEELAERCRSAGLNCETEVGIRVTYKTFSKSYYLDLLVEHGAVYELKTSETLNRGHESQLLNYLLVNQLRHGKLINFRPVSVQHRFVSTTISNNDRFEYSWLPINAPEPLSEAGRRFILLVQDLLREWGAFLDTNLYREAVTAMIVGPGTGIQPVDILVDRRTIGHQNMNLLNRSEAWHISSIRTAQSAYEEHLTRQLHHTGLNALYWINLNHRTITLKIIKK